MLHGVIGFARSLSRSKAYRDMFAVNVRLSEQTADVC
jgi:hypothetical protein